MILYLQENQRVFLMFQIFIKEQPHLWKLLYTYISLYRSLTAVIICYALLRKFNFFFFFAINFVFQFNTVLLTQHIRTIFFFFLITLYAKYISHPYLLIVKKLFYYSITHEKTSNWINDSFFLLNTYYIRTLVTAGLL